MTGKEILEALKEAGEAPVTHIFVVIDRAGDRHECRHTFVRSDVYELSGKTVYPEHRGRGVVVVDNATSRAATAMNLEVAFDILDRSICTVCGQQGYGGLCLKCRLTCNNLP